MDQCLWTCFASILPTTRFLLLSGSLPWSGLTRGMPTACSVGRPALANALHRPNLAPTLGVNKATSAAMLPSSTARSRLPVELSNVSFASLSVCLSALSAVWPLMDHVPCLAIVSTWLISDFWPLETIFASRLLHGSNVPKTIGSRSDCTFETRSVSCTFIPAVPARTASLDGTMRVSRVCCACFETFGWRTSADV